MPFVTSRLTEKCDQLKLDQLAQIHIRSPSGKKYLELFWDPKKCVAIAVPEDERLGQHEVCMKADIASVVEEIIGCYVYSCSNAWIARGELPAQPEATTLSQVRKDYVVMSINLTCL